MKTSVFSLSALWSDTFIAVGLLTTFAVMGFASHQFALQANLFGL